MDDSHTVAYLRRVYMQPRLLTTAFLTFIPFYYTKNYRVLYFSFLEGENFRHFNIFVLGRPHSHLFVAPKTTHTHTHTHTHTPVLYKDFYEIRRQRKCCRSGSPTVCRIPFTVTLIVENEEYKPMYLHTFTQRH
jgi:hypothetical protein